MKNGKTDPFSYGDLPDLVGYQLRRTQKAVFQHFSGSLAEVGVSPGQFGVLTLIEANEGLSQSALARILGIERSTMVAVIDALEAKGWIERTLSETDRRSNALMLTKSGARLLKKARPLLAGHETEITADLSADEKRVLLELLQRVATNAENS